MKKIIGIIAAVFLVSLIAWISLNPNGRDEVKPKENEAREGIDVNETAETAPSVKMTDLELVDFLRAPEGWSVSYFAKDLGPARVITFDPNGTMLVSIPTEGKVVALPDRDKDGNSDEAITVVNGLKQPHGLAFRSVSGNQLYVAETDKVQVFDYDINTMNAQNGRKILDLPTGGGHASRSLLYLPNDDKLLISSGSSCNVCVETDKRRAAILVANPDGGNSRIYADGLRNSVFMRENPSTGEVWATDMGRDHLGDNLPPDEINIVKDQGFYGWPYAYGNKVLDTEFNADAKDQADRSVPSQIDIPAHSAPLGLAFLDGNFWPDGFQNNLLVAYHGSWNRSVPTGYKVVRFSLDQNGSSKQVEDFITGFSSGGSVKGRPVDLVTHNGIIFISDDKAGAVYKVTQK